MGKRAGFFALTLLLGLVVATSPAQAHARKFPTQVSLSYDGTTFSGQVSSTNPDCVPGRQVTLFQRARGGDDVAQAITTTDGDGNYSFALPDENGLFYVQVSAMNIPGGYQHSHTCNGAQSRTVKAGDGGVLGAGLEQGGDDGADVSGAAEDALPGTGARGVIAFTALGAALIAAGLVLVRRYRSRPRDTSPIT